MTPAEFDAVVERRFAQARAVLAAKAADYAADADRLHNFKAAAAEFGGTPAQCLWGMLRKHLVSLLDMVEGRREVTPGAVDEKLGDALNYLVLLEAVFREELGRDSCP